MVEKMEAYQTYSSEADAHSFILSTKAGGQALQHRKNSVGGEGVIVIYAFL